MSYWSMFAKNRRYLKLAEECLKPAYWKRKHQDWARLLTLANQTKYVKFLGNTMAPTFDDSEKLLEVRISEALNGVYKGDVVCLKHPEDDKRLLIRRVTAGPGEEIVSETGEESFKLDTNEFWISNDVDTIAEESSSRAFGPVKAEQIVGRVLTVVDNNYVRRSLVVNSPKATLEDAAANLMSVQEVKTWAKFTVQYQDYIKEFVGEYDKQKKGHEQGQKDKTKEKEGGGKEGETGDSEAKKKE